MPDRLRLLLLIVTALVVPSGLRAQATCDGGEISHVFIDNHSIFDLDDLPVDRARWAFQLANFLHIRTRQSFIRRELLFRVGDCYDAFLIADSERALRRLPFISNAEVFGIRQPDGDWHVLVDTRDEWSTQVEITAEFENGIDIRSLALEEENFLGRGFQVTGFWTRNNANELVGGAFFTPQLFGSRTNFGVGGGSTRVGHFWNGAVTYPFNGENGRYAGRAAGGLVEDYFDYSAGTPQEPGHVLLPIEERRWELTAARRFGEPGNLSSVGIGIARAAVDALGFPESLEVIEGDDFGNPLPAPPEVIDEVARQTFFTSGTRIHLLFGQRNVRFIQRTGLDALRGVSDLEVGSDVSLTLGRSLGIADAPEDFNLRARLYGAGAPGAFTIVSEVGIDGRQVFFDPTNERRGWRDILAHANVLIYWQPQRFGNHTFFARVAGAGGWNVDRPFQLTLGGRRGLRAFRQEDYPGARRLVVNVEDRVYLGWPAPDLFDMGFTVFADVGRMLPGDVPFGRDSGWRGSVGAGLRIGFPAGTRGVARIDLAWPLGAGNVSGGPILRISLADLLGIRAGFEDPQMNRSRLLRVGLDRLAPTRHR